MPAEKLLEAAARFHGHLGPWLALGLKAGLLARRRLKAPSFNLVANVYCPTRTPYTCFVDGVQFGSGCTYGKGSIFLFKDTGCRAVFVRTGSSAANLKLTLRHEVWDDLHRDLPAAEPRVRALARAIYRRPVPSLFTIG